MDPIADMLTRLRNAIAVHHDTVLVPHSKIKTEILRILKRTDFIERFERKGKKVRKSIVVTLRYESDGAPAITGLKRISTPGRRVYRAADKVHPVRQGFGMMILSTPAGLLTDKEARKQHIGGEVICTIW
ncbi:MAG: 30S ribosomal protein S8 [Patescibacteria group bacterium]|mgnify:CR=1 FL=1